MTAAELQHLLAADLHRYERAMGWTGFVRTFVREPGFRLTTLLRLSRYLRAQVWPRWGAYHACRFWLRRLSVKLGVYIEIKTEIGPGIYLPHACGIIVNRRCRIGSNCNLSQHVTLGWKSREPNVGCPVIGDRVYIGPGPSFMAPLPWATTPPSVPMPSSPRMFPLMPSSQGFRPA